jgi:hypothetical protein
MGALAVLGAIIVIALVIGIAYFLFTHTSSISSQLSPLPQFQNTNAPVPTAIKSAFSGSSEAATYQLATLTQTELSNISQFTIIYNGSLYAQPSGALGVVATINTPLHIKESKYGGDLKFSINATGIPVVGNGDIDYLEISNATYLCTNFNSSALSSQNYGKIISSNKSISCLKSNDLAGIKLSSLAQFNLSILESIGIKINYTNIYQSTYRGIPCTYISGALMQNSSNGTKIGAGSFEMCLSDKYYLPLSISLNFNSKAIAVRTDINETYTANYSNQSYVDALPGPLVAS